LNIIHLTVTYRKATYRIIFIVIIYTFTNTVREIATFIL